MTRPTHEHRILDLFLTVSLFNGIAYFGIRPFTLIALAFLVITATRIKVDKYLFLLVCVLLVYSIYGYVDLKVYVTHQRSFGFGAERPFLTLFQVGIELLLVQYVSRRLHDSHFDISKQSLLLSQALILLVLTLYAVGFFFDNELSRIVTYIPDYDCDDCIALRGFMTEPGPFCAILLAVLRLTLLKVGIRSVTKWAPIFIAALLTKSGLLLLTPIVFFDLGSRKKAKYLLIPALVVAGFFVVSESVPTKLAALLNPNPSDTGGRYIGNFVAIEGFLRHPLLGNGFSSYDAVRHQSDLPLALDVFDHGGSDLLLLLSDTGLFGFTAIIFLLYKNAVRKGSASSFGFLYAAGLTAKGSGLFSAGFLFVLSIMLLRWQKQCPSIAGLHCSREHPNS